MKKAFVFFICAIIALQAMTFVAPVRTASAAEPKGDFFSYEYYESYDYLQIDFILGLTVSTTSDMEVSLKHTFYDVFDSLEAFFKSYEKLMYNNTHAKFMRNKEVEPYSSTNNPYYLFNMYIYFQGDDEMTAVEKYREYFKREKGDPMEPTKTGLFADRYQYDDATHFYVPNGLPDYNEFTGEFLSYEGVQSLASLSAVMVPFLLYGDKVALITDEGLPMVGIDFEGLVSLYPAYFAERNTLTTFFKGFELSHTFITDTGYVKTDADVIESYMGEYAHTWYIASGTNNNYNRLINFTYIELKVLNMYLMSIAAALLVAGIMAFFIFALPKIKKKEGEGNV